MIATALLLAGCAPGEKAQTQFGHAAGKAKTELSIIRSRREKSPRGFALLDVEVLLPPTVTESAAHEAIQRVIDSIAVADTMIVSVRVTGFQMQNVDAKTASADVVPMITATWAPLDTLGVVGSLRRAPYRTDFVILHPLPQGGDSTK